MKKNQVNILIIGAEKDSTSMLQMFRENKTVNILGIVDVNPQAKGIKLAKKMGVPTAGDWKQFIKDANLNEIIDASGSDEIYQQLLKDKPKNVGIIGGPAARVMWLLFDEHQKAEKQIQQNKDFLQNIFESLPHPFYVVNIQDYTVEMANSAAGFAKWPQAKKCYTLSHESDKPCQGADCPCPLEEIKKTKRPVIAEHVHRAKGRNLSYEVHAYPIFDKDGNVVKMVEYSFDITKRKKTENNLKEAKEELEIQAWGLQKANESIKILYKELEQKNRELQKLDDLKSDFVSTVSHELRTPLSIMREGISLVLDEIPGEVNEQQKKFLNIAQTNIDRLARVINDLLDISKLEAGRIDLKKQKVNLNSLLENLIVALEPKAKAKGLEIKLNMPQEEVSAYADADRVAQVFINLVYNAIKFTKEGFIEISFKQEDDGVECIVSDTGMGISKDNLPNVFSKFRQFGRNHEAGEQGTGLGLAITKGIVELHNGNIWVESQYGKGTRFIFTLPKYTPQTVLKAKLDNAINQATKKNAKFSLVIAAIEELDTLKQKFSVEKINSIMKDIQEALGKSLRGQEDATSIMPGQSVIILSDCDREGTLRVVGRLEKTLEDYVVTNNLTEYIKFKLNCITYPDDVKDLEELIKKING